MATGVADLLREGRKKQRLSIEECSKRTHISARFLEALEQGRWQELPSESHRVGFLQLYSRFLGVPTEDVMTLYRQANHGPELGGSITVPESSEHPTPERRARPVTTTGVTWPGLVAVGAILFVGGWFAYHAIGRQTPESAPVNWATRFHPHHSKLIPPKVETRVQRIKLAAAQDSWIRILEEGHLLFEGNVTAGTTKNWAAPGPFEIVVGDIRTASLSVNDLPVDLSAGVHGHTATVDVPSASSGQAFPPPIAASVPRSSRDQ